MKRIAFICELIGTNRQGGENLAMQQLAQLLKEKNYKVDVYTYTNKNRLLKINSAIPLKLRLLPFVRELFFVPIIGYKLFKKIENKYDYIFASSMTIASLYKPKSHLVIVCHLIRSQKFDNLSKVPKYKIFFNPLTRKLMEFLEKKSLSNANQIIVIRKQQKKYIENVLKVKRKINVIPNGIDVNTFRPINISKKLQIIFVGRGTIPKGIDTLLKAADNIKSQILIVTQKIDKQFVDLAKTKSNVYIKQNSTPRELASLYSESKIFVLPSLNEEQPLSTIEAMACGLPVVVTQEAASDIVTNDINGVIIPPRNPKALSESVNRLLKDDKILNIVGKKNRKHIVENFNQNKMVMSVINLLND